ncbi:MAG: hypothetical protein IBJ12_11745 [Sphingomonadaceae bacterium]|nr:hypothetical protein [Sphingomonadaceae bacterium]
MAGAAPPAGDPPAPAIIPKAVAAAAPGEAPPADDAAAKTKEGTEHTGGVKVSPGN